MIRPLARLLEAAADRGYFVEQRLRDRAEASRLAGPLVRWHWRWLAIPITIGAVFLGTAANVVSSPSWLQNLLAGVGLAALALAWIVVGVRSQVLGHTVSVHPEAEATDPPPPPVPRP